MKIRVAICQVDMEWENTARNLKRLEPIVAAADADAAQAYQDVVARLLGEERPMRFTEAVKTGFFKRIFGGR